MERTFSFKEQIELRGKNLEFIEKKKKNRNENFALDEQ